MSRALLLLPVVLLGCGPRGPAVATNTFVGTVSGESLVVQEAFVSILRTAGGVPSGAGVVLSGTAGLCNQLKANRQPKSMTYVVFLMGLVGGDGSSSVPGAGDFTVFDGAGGLPAGRDAQSFFAKLDATCSNTVASDRALGKSGLVKVSSLSLQSSGAARGTFDVTYGTQKDRVTGSFDAPFCDVPTMTAAPSCE